jgi:hypothetical protein
LDRGGGGGFSYSSALGRRDEFRQSIHLIGKIAMRRRTKIILAVIGVALVCPFAQFGPDCRAS